MSNKDIESDKRVQQGSVTLQEEPGVQRVVPASRAHAQPPREDLELCLEQPDLVPELGPGLGHEAGVYARVEAAPGVDAERVTLLGGRAAQHRDQPAVGKSFREYLSRNLYLDSLVFIFKSRACRKY